MGVITTTPNKKRRKGPSHTGTGMGERASVECRGREGLRPHKGSGRRGGEKARRKRKDPFSVRWLPMAGGCGASGAGKGGGGGCQRDAQYRKRVPPKKSTALYLLRLPV